MDMYSILEPNHALDICLSSKRARLRGKMRVEVENSRCRHYMKEREVGTFYLVQDYTSLRILITTILNP